MAAKANFEVHVMRDGRWSTESVRESEEEARSIARKFLADRKCEGARILRNWMRGDGKMVEAEIFCETRAVKDDGPIRINPLEEAPHCEAPADYYASGSRMAMNRLFRTYLEKTFLTPTEMIHNYRELRRVQDKDLLVPSAVDRVSVLQVRDTDRDPRERREEIHKQIDRMSARARRAETMALPKLNGSFKSVRAKTAALAEKEADADFLALVVLSEDLVGTRNWVGKLDKLCRLALQEDDPASLRLLDGVIADVLGANVVTELLGWQASLGHAIISLVDLADGRLAGEKSDASDVVSMLNQLLSAGKLPESRLCLLDRAHRQLRSPNALYRSDPSKEQETLTKVIARLLGPDGLLSGPETAEALTTRFTRMVEEGGATGRRAAIAGIFRSMPDRAAGLIYLGELAASSYGEEHLADIATTAEAAFNARQLADLCQRSLPPRDRMHRATVAFRIIANSPLPAALRDRLTKHIDSVLDRFLVEEKVIERLDDQASPLKDRAIRLVQFCAANILPEGKAMNRARERIITLLRQPNFDAHFVEGITDPAAAQKSLRDFHLLLVKAGFGK